MLERRDFVYQLMLRRDSALVVSSLGNPTYDLAAAGDTPANFYFWGAMGGAATFGLGLAMSQPRHRVVVLLGDGEIMMGLGSLATIVAQRPGNLALVVLDNFAFAETGAQTGLTATGIDISSIAAATGFQHTMSISSVVELDDFARLVFQVRGPVLGRAEISMSDDEKVVPEWDGNLLSSRMREHLHSV